MRNFELNQRVLVGRISLDGSEDGVLFHPDTMLLGQVVRLRRCDRGAWVRLDKRLADATLHPFPEGDPRANHVLTFPKWCLPEGCSHE